MSREEYHLKTEYFKVLGEIVLYGYTESHLTNREIYSSHKFFFLYNKIINIFDKYYYLHFGKDYDMKNDSRRMYNIYKYSALMGKYLYKSEHYDESKMVGIMGKVDKAGLYKDTCEKYMTYIANTLYDYGLRHKRCG